MLYTEWSPVSEKSLLNNLYRRYVAGRSTPPATRAHARTLADSQELKDYVSPSKLADREKYAAARAATVTAAAPAAGPFTAARFAPIAIPVPAPAPAPTLPTPTTPTRAPTRYPATPYTTGIPRPATGNTPGAARPNRTTATGARPSRRPSTCPAALRAKRLLAEKEESDEDEEEEEDIDE
ncbi:hypothetical protein QBC39DRAFT_335572 [Podospora conica]|nr:hypothetical protein QBC39DRAFT_335572 [Schizothecium conicum]